MDQAEKKAREMVYEWHGIDAPLLEKDIVEALREQSAALSRAVAALDFYERLGTPKGCTPVGGGFEDPDWPKNDAYWQDQGKRAREALSSPDIKWWARREELRERLHRASEVLYEEADPHGLERDYVSVRIGDYNRVQEALDEIQAHEAARPKEGR